MKRYIVLMGTLFNQIYITRTDSEGDTNDLIRVPITYGPKEKVLARVQADPNLDRPVANILPYITFEMTHLNYNGKRHIATVGRKIGESGTNKDVVPYVYQPAPYDFFFDVNIMVKNAEDGVKIVEQILGFFTPSWTVTLRIMDEPEVIRDIPVTIKDVFNTDDYDGSLQKRRVLTWTLKFVVQGYLYGPENKGKIIKVVKSKVGGGGSDPALRHDYALVTVRPGLTAGGEPTSSPSETVPYSEIDWTDDYGFVVEDEILE